MAEALHVLPLAGGLFDQPAIFITRMEAVLRATVDLAEVPGKAEEAKRKLEGRVERIGVQGS